MAKQPDSPARTRFAQVAALTDDRINLAEAALLIAAEEYPALDVTHYLEKLDHCGALARERAAGVEGATGKLAALNELMFEELGFRGNQTAYADPRNSFLNEVIDRRTGIPITLTVVYMEVARRAGLPVRGVGLPFHFIAKFEGAGGDLFIDPFNGGRLLGEAGCAEIVERLSQGALRLRPEHLAAAGNKQILTRMLTNLLNIYAGSNDHRRAIGVLERLLLLNPQAAAYRRDLGLLLAHLGEAGRALTELEQYLAHAPDAPEAESLQTLMKSLKQERARWN